MISKQALNEYLINKFLEFSNVEGDISDDLYQLGRYDAFNEVSDFLNDLDKND